MPAAFAANDGEQLASLFAEYGTCKDGFLRAHTGRPQIAAMLQRFYDTGRDVALVQLDFSAERIKRVLERAAATKTGP